MDFHGTSAHGADDDHDQAPHAEIVALHTKDRSPCPLSGDYEHRHDRDRPLHPQCAALGGRNGYGVLCRCGTLLDSGSKLAAIEDKARHLALHRGDLLVHRVVHDSHGTRVIHELQTLGHRPQKGHAMSTNEQSPPTAPAACLRTAGDPDGAQRAAHHRDDLDDAAWDGRGIPLPAEDNRI
ncbi:hypothetical protein [Streptomyces sp. B29(2018)]|uniref:hypothetical protein n=1 Tax=Streptomyces sp. B29(2018) TaxID=2485016 RepID=UPI000FD66465|nr:hypothetical protein [Streptomyces sp. B29(2018)]